jgi:hypothetical protein
MRSLGAAIGISALGAIMAGRISGYTESGLARLGIHGAGSGGSLPQLSALPGPVRAVVESAYGHGIADVFLFNVPLALLAVAAVLLIREVPLRDREPSLGLAAEPTEPGQPAEAAEPAEAAQPVQTAQFAGPATAARAGTVDSS